MPATTALLEREDELAAIDRALDAAAEGSGGVLAIEGEAGIGKTSLLDAAAALAGERGMAVLHARGGEHERDFPYGIVRQLFEPPLSGAAGGDALLAGAAALAAPAFGATAEAGGDQFGIRHGLYWLTANLADRAPLALLVDDAQWADLASLRALAYIAHRVAELPLLLAIGIRVGEPGAHEALIDELRRAARRGWLRPRPLGADSVAELVARELGGDPAAGVADACRTASAGNPFLVGEMLRALASDEAAPGDGDLAESVAAAGAARSILLRLVRLGDDALATARAVAVLEPNATLHSVGALTGLDTEAVAATSERLVAARLLADATPLVFVHPLVRAAVYEDLSHPRRAAMHARAARLLSAAGAAADTVAGHLLLSEPGGDPWVVDELRRAAQAALARGAPEGAARYLQRALAEPPAMADRAAVGGELGLAQLRCGDPAGIDTLTRLRAGTPDLAVGTELVVELANSLALRGRTAEAVTVLEEALAAHGDRRDAIGLCLRGQMLVIPVDGLEGIPPGAPREPGEEVDLAMLDGRVLLDGEAFLLACGAGRLEDAVALVRPIVADRDVALADANRGRPCYRACCVLTLGDDAATAGKLFGPLIEATRGRGSFTGVAAGLGARAVSSLVDGDLRAAEVDAQAAVEMAGHSGLVVESYWLAVLILVLVERGELEAAGELVARPAGSGPLSGLPGACLLCARGELELAAGRPAAAGRDFAAAAERVEWLPHASEEIVGWRTGLARAEAAMGDVAAAGRRAAEAVEHARIAAGPRGLGVALRVQGLVDPVAGVDALRKAAELLADTNARLQHARALVDLGAALRRANARREARDPLREGLDLAHRCGATTLEERARVELAATGARPRTAVLSGVESLTPSELRVARMAAGGMTNREIAGQLFVTAKTVETHLRHVYQKLDVAKRDELAAKL